MSRGSDKAEKGSYVQRWKEDTKDFAEMKELHAWLHNTHLCYSVSRQVSCCDELACTELAWIALDPDCMREMLHVVYPGAALIVVLYRISCGLCQQSVQAWRSK